jgi:hypothetical protein
MRWMAQNHEFFFFIRLRGRRRHYTLVALTASKHVAVNHVCKAFTIRQSVSCLYPPEMSLLLAGLALKDTVAHCSPNDIFERSRL